MRKSKDGKGAICNVCSVHGHTCTKLKPVYNITKFGLRSLAQSIFAEGEGRIKEMMTPVEVANPFILGFSRFAKYLIGGDLLFDGGMVLTYQSVCIRWPERITGPGIRRGSAREKLSLDRVDGFYDYIPVHS